jgi:hypothetical protein
MLFAATYFLEFVDDSAGHIGRHENGRHSAFVFVVGQERGEDFFGHQIRHFQLIGGVCSGRIGPLLFEVLCVERGEERAVRKRKEQE